MASKTTIRPNFKTSVTVFQYTDFPAGEKPSISTIFQVKGNFDKTRRMINGMKIVQHVNSTTQQKQLLYFPPAFSLSLGGNNRSVCHGLSRNLSLRFANMGQFQCFLTDHSLIPPEQKSYQLKAHF